MAGAIHVSNRGRKTWMPGTSPGMTTFRMVANGLKLLRGQALSDMSGLRGKFAENCGDSSFEPLQSRKLSQDRAEVSCGAAAHVLGWLHSHNRSREANGFTTLVRR
jgi:hypothetical protein